MLHLFAILSYYYSLTNLYSNDRREVYFYFKQKMLEAHPEYEKQFEQFEQLTDEVNADFDDVEFWGPYVLIYIVIFNCDTNSISDTLLRFSNDITYLFQTLRISVL